MVRCSFSLSLSLYLYVYICVAGLGSPVVAQSGDRFPDYIVCKGLGMRLRYIVEDTLEVACNGCDMLHYSVRLGIYIHTRNRELMEVLHTYMYIE